MRKRPSNYFQNANHGQGGHWIRTEKRKRIYERDGHRCVYCFGESGCMTLTLDHVLPRPKGSNHESNLVTACLSCNSAKGDLSAVEFAFKLHPDKRFPVLFAWAILDRVIEAMGMPPAKPERKRKAA